MVPSDRTSSLLHNNLMVPGLPKNPRPRYLADSQIGEKESIDGAELPVLDCNVSIVYINLYYCTSFIIIKLYIL